MFLNLFFIAIILTFIYSIIRDSLRIQMLLIQSQTTGCTLPHSPAVYPPFPPAPLDRFTVTSQEIAGSLLLSIRDNERKAHGNIVVSITRYPSYKQGVRNTGVWYSAHAIATQNDLKSIFEKEEPSCP